MVWHRLFLRHSFATRGIRLLSTTTADASISSSSKTSTDVLIVGGGVVGAALARRLALQMPHLDVLVVDGGPNVLDDANDGISDSIPHPRSYALSPSSLRLLGLLEESGTTNPAHNSTNHSQHTDLTLKKLGWYSSMQVWEAGQPASLLFTAEHDLPKAEALPHLGAVAEDAALKRYLWEDLHRINHKNVTLQPHTKLLDAKRMEQGGVQVQVAHQNTTTSAATTTTETIHTKLLVAADGANSWVRQHFQMPVRGFRYADQRALTCTVELEGNMRGRAFQRFASDGHALALLPTHDPRHAIVIWSTTPEQAQYYSQPQNHAELIEVLQDSLQTGPERLEPILSSTTTNHSSAWDSLKYGLDKVVDVMQYGPTLAAQHTLQADGFRVPPRIAGIATVSSALPPVLTFPLSCQQVDQYYDRNIALVGDAAHSVHPLAGQGLNVGLADVDQLVLAVAAAVRAGMPLASLLESQYHSLRKPQVSATLVGIHAVQQAFAQTAGRGDVLAHAKSLGMNCVQAVGPLRRQLVRTACGLD